MIGSRRYPCGHGFVRVSEVGAHRRVCPVCAAAYTVTVAVAPYVSGRIGRPVLKVSWERDAKLFAPSG